MMMMMRFFRWQRRCCSGKREKKPTTTSCYYLKTCVSVCYALKRNSREQPLLESSRERARYTFWGMMCSKMIRKDERKARKIFKEIFCATRTRETQENRRGGFVRLGAERKLWCQKVVPHEKIFFNRSIFVNFWQIFWFSFWFELFSTLLLSKTASLKERQLLITHINNMAKRTKSARKAAKSVRPNGELLAREDETRSHLLLPFFFARF